jgi:phytoene dehydrogenase-like protein
VANNKKQRAYQRFPGLASLVEMSDISTPLTFERYTGNWQASFAGFLPIPQTLVSSIPKTLPGSANFYMAGQCVQAGGGLPTGVSTCREAVIKMCKQDGIRFSGDGKQIRR